MTTCPQKRWPRKLGGKRINNRAEDDVEFAISISKENHHNLFYENKEEMVEGLSYYFKEGIEKNECCLWITSENVTIEDAKNALNRLDINTDFLIHSGQLEILNQEQHLSEGYAENIAISKLWDKKHRDALQKGHPILRTNLDLKTQTVSPQ